MFKHIKKMFSGGDQEPDLSRRKFIRDAGALAALTFAAVNVPKVLLEQRTADIQAQIESGVVSGQTFYIDEPIIIEIDGVTITDCTFIATQPMPYMFRINGSNITIRNCRLETNGLVDIGMQFTPHTTGADMTQTFQSAVDTLANSPEGKVLRLTEGSYHVNSPITLGGVKLYGKS